MKFDAAQASHARLARGAGNFAQFNGAAGGQAGAARGARGAGGGFVTGSVIAKDDKSVTVQVMGGGSKIVFFTDKTEVMKSATGTAADLVNGTQVIITGAGNPDGSVNATSIQIRPTPPANTNQ
jgi:hypothetical protein